MANPKVRPHLSFYPEDSGNNISEARQARRWLHEAPNEKLGPMARLGDQDFYIHEPAMLTDSTCCIPVRWFRRGDMLFAKCWKMETVSTDQQHGWRVLQTDDYIVSPTQFLKNFPQLLSDAATYGLPPPSNIIGLFCLLVMLDHIHSRRIIDVFDPEANTHTAWKFTNPVLGNRWRELAKGHRVLCFPIWMYCDDTSGNTSKKWNEHNSFLFTPAGLPCSESQREYNIHFLSTSNIAPPLEMMDGIVEQIEYVQFACHSTDINTVDIQGVRGQRHMGLGLRGERASASDPDGSGTAWR